MTVASDRFDISWSKGRPSQRRSAATATRGKTVAQTSRTGQDHLSQDLLSIVDAYLAQAIPKQADVRSPLERRADRAAAPAEPIATKI
jgi:hypothetical protein